MKCAFIKTLAVIGIIAVVVYFFRRKKEAL